MWNCDPRGGFKAKVDDVRERLQEGELWQLNGTRQSRENIARIALSGPFRWVEIGVNCDRRWAFKGKVGTGINGQLGARGKRSN